MTGQKGDRCHSCQTVEPSTPLALVPFFSNYSAENTCSTCDEIEQETLLYAPYGHLKTGYDIGSTYYTLPG